MGDKMNTFSIVEKIIKIYYDIKFSRKNKKNSKKAINKFGNKTIMSATETLQIKAKANLEAQKTEQMAKNIFKKYAKDPNKLLNFIEEKGTKVIRMGNADKVLGLINEAEGFITPIQGVKALFLTLAINLFSKEKMPIGFQTPAMFVLRNMNVNVYSMAHQFYHWLSYIKKLPGYEQETIDNFKNIWKLDNNPTEIQKLSIEEIIDLKNAIERDIQAIDFVRNLAKEYEGSKKVHQKMQHENGAII